jgi:hypothetical protein
VRDCLQRVINDVVKPADRRLQPIGSGFHADIEVPTGFRIKIGVADVVAQCIVRAVEIEFE